MKAIYPIVGGTDSAHAVNLKTPGTYNLTFATGWTHSSTGMTPNGATYAATGLNPSLVLSSANVHVSNYSRTQNSSVNGAQIGAYDGVNEINLYQYFNAVSRKGGSLYFYPTYSVLVNNSNTKGFQINTRRDPSDAELYFNGFSVNTNTATETRLNVNMEIYLGASKWSSGANQYSPHEHAFDSIGDGLTDTEAANFYTAVQAFQTTLGRSIGTQTVSDSDAQAFVTAAAIDDQVQANAINNLVIGLKADSLWTKMKAIYPIVGGTDSAHAVNLKSPGTFNLSFASGWTHSSNGMTPLNSYADTSFNSSVNGLQDSQHISYYSRTNSNGTEIEMGGIDAGSKYSFIEARTSGISYYGMNQSTPFISHSDTDSRAFYISNRTASNVINGWRNGVKTATGTTASASTNVAYQLGAVNNLVVPSNKFYSTKQCAFASIGDGLTDTEAANLNTRVNTYQTALSRNV
jgi:hypothetical protein